MKRIGIIRGPSLSKWETQIYEPLIKWFDITCITSTLPLHDISRINFPVIKLLCPAQYISQIPFSLHFMFNQFGDTQYLYDFDKKISGFDLLHSVELASYYSLQAVRAKQKGLVKAVTLTIYENIPFIYDEYPARRLLKEEVLHFTDHFLAANDRAKQALILEGVDKSKISIIPQSIDTKFFYPPRKTDIIRLNKLRKLQSFDKDDFIVLFVGRMVWEKGIFDILRTAVGLKKISKIKFLLAGDGPEMSACKKFVNREGIENSVKFLGMVPYSQMSDIFRISDIMVHASLPTRYWNEQFGGCLIEAMATGLPIVGTLNGGIVETVGKDGGIFIQPQDSPSLIQAILKFYYDKKLKLQISQRNWKTALKKYDSIIVAKKIRRIWNALLS